MSTARKNNQNPQTETAQSFLYPSEQGALEAETEQLHKYSFFGKLKNIGKCVLGLTAFGAAVIGGAEIAGIGSHKPLKSSPFENAPKTADTKNALAGYADAQFAITAIPKTEYIRPLTARQSAFWNEASSLLSAESPAPERTETESKKDILENEPEETKQMAKSERLAEDFGMAELMAGAEARKQPEQLENQRHTLASSGKVAGISWTLSGSGILNVTGTGEIPEKCFYGKFEIKSAFIGEGITSIGAYAFYKALHLQSIEIPNTVTSVKTNAFAYCEDLENITFPDSVTSIGTFAFAYCTSLNYIMIPNSVTSIDCFGSSDLGSLKACEGGFKAYFNIRTPVITIPDSVKAIGAYAFYNGGIIKKYVIPSHVKTIGSHAFGMNHYLESLIIENGVSEIGRKAFYDCGALKTVFFPDSIKSIDCFESSALSAIQPSEGGFTAYFGSNAVPAQVEIPSYITSIGNRGFYGTSMESVVVPAESELKTIGEEAFASCPKVKTITLGDGITSIGKSAFFYCSELTGKFELPKGITDIQEDTFVGSRKLTEVTIPDGVTTIADRAFMNCEGLTTAVIPESVVSLNKFAFCNCKALTSVSIPDSISSIPQGAFDSCTSLTSVSIPDGVVEIGDSAFSGCTGVTTVNLPESVAVIGTKAFEKCTALQSVYYCGKKDVSYGTDVFSNAQPSIYVSEDYEDTAFCGADVVKEDVALCNLPKRSLKPTATFLPTKTLQPSQTFAKTPIQSIWQPEFRTAISNSNGFGEEGGGNINLNDNESKTGGIGAGAAVGITFGVLAATVGAAVGTVAAVKRGKCKRKKPVGAMESSEDMPAFDGKTEDHSMFDSQTMPSHENKKMDDEKSEIGLSV